VRKLAPKQKDHSPIIIAFAPEGFHSHYTKLIQRMKEKGTKERKRRRPYSWPLDASGRAFRHLRVRGFEVYGWLLGAEA
jgi:hypothetical protein